MKMNRLASLSLAAGQSFGVDEACHCAGRNGSKHCTGLSELELAACEQRVCI